MAQQVEQGARRPQVVARCQEARSRLPELLPARIRPALEPADAVGERASGVELLGQAPHVRQGRRHRLAAEILTASFRVLVRIAREAVDVLSQPELLLPDTALRSTLLTPLEYAEQIRPVLLELEAALVEVEDQKRIEEAQKVRTKALEASRKTNVYGSRLLEALFVLAGEEFHAARLRPKVSQLASSDEDLGSGPPDDEDGGESPDDGEADDGETDDGETDDGEPSDEDGESPDPSA